MSVLGIGVDLVECVRIERSLERFGEKFLHRVFTDGEIEYSMSMKFPARHLAARFAAMEAVSQAFGSGIGIQIGGSHLEVAAARVRPSRIRVLGRLTIENFVTRPAAEWGSEYARFLKSLGIGHLSATVLLPRGEVIVRQLPGAGVS